MSHFTPADAGYLKGIIRQIAQLSEDAPHSIICEKDRDAAIERVEAFIDGCTLEKGK